jgi:vacuolar-type H+-ATPase subunit H
MKEIIQEVLQAEENVSARLKEARAQAAEIRSSAENEVSDRIKEAKTQARELVQSMAEQARQDAQQHKEERLKQADQADEALIKGDSETIDQLVDKICTLIVATAQDKDAE